MYSLNCINQTGNSNKTSVKFEKVSPKYIKKQHCLKIFPDKNGFLYICVCACIYYRGWGSAVLQPTLMQYKLHYPSSLRKALRSRSKEKNFLALCVGEESSQAKHTAQEKTRTGEGNRGTNALPGLPWDGKQCSEAVKNTIFEDDHCAWIVSQSGLWRIWLIKLRGKAFVKSRLVCRALPDLKLSYYFL